MSVTSTHRGIHAPISDSLHTAWYLSSLRLSRIYVSHSSGTRHSTHRMRAAQHVAWTRRLFQAIRKGLEDWRFARIILLLFTNCYWLFLFCFHSVFFRDSVIVRAGLMRLGIYHFLSVHVSDTSIGRISRKGFGRYSSVVPMGRCARVQKYPVIFITCCCVARGRSRSKSLLSLAPIDNTDVLDAPQWTFAIRDNDVASIAWRVSYSNRLSTLVVYGSSRSNRKGNLACVWRALICLRSSSIVNRYKCRVRLENSTRKHYIKPENVVLRKDDEGARGLL